MPADVEDLAGAAEHGRADRGVAGEAAHCFRGDMETGVEGASVEGAGVEGAGVEAGVEGAGV
ncbi:hypothetical protein JOD64_003481 [Micromonospora luteifusca]|uniref:Uncharacterized protein n=1 Tax=Micromonospora luteifusca TaxID=709860 RepID=A0ABS2LX64_9ACTN|nr:hypothetical protein [Micromonospora luteifusca]